MAFEKNLTPEGKISLKFEDGYHLDPMDPLAATEELAKSRDDRARVAREEKQRADKLQTELDTLRAAAPPAPTPTPAQQSEEQLRSYLVEEHAKGLGFGNAAEYRAALGKVQSVTAEMENQVIASNFMASCQDFPNTPQSVEALGKKIEEMKWDFSPQAMIAAHSLLIRENSQDATKGYKPLTAEEINASWANNMAAANRPSPPPMIRSDNPETRPQLPDVNTEPLDKMRARLLGEMRRQA